MNYRSMAKVYSYARWSSPEQAKGDSFRRQSEAAAKWAARKGLELDTSLSILDEGVSAYRGTNAGEDSGLGRFLFACRRGLIDPGSYLLVESLDRVSRMTPRRAQAIINEIVDAGVTIVTLSDGQEYTAERLDNDQMSLLVAFMVAWRAHEESKTKGRRVAAAWEAKRKKAREGQGGIYTRRAPAWLQWDPAGARWNVIEDRADVIRGIYRDKLAGIGEHQIARRLNDGRVQPFGRARQWHRSAVAKLLEFPAVIGTMVPGRMDFSTGRKRRVADDPIPNAFPAIVSEADWLAVRAIKDGSTAAVRGRHAGKAVTHILAGLARCPVCDGTMTRVSKGRRSRPKLVCVSGKTGTGCSYVSVPVQEVEDAIIRDWGALLENVPAGQGEGALDAEHDKLAANIAGTEQHLMDLAEALEAAPSAAGAVRLARVEAELRTMRADLEALDERRAMADRGLLRTRLGDVAELLSAADDDPASLDRAAVNAGLRSVFKGAVVDYRAGRVRLQWRQGGEVAVVYAWRDVLPA